MGAGEKRRILRSYDEMGGELYDERYKSEQASKYDMILRHSVLSADTLVLDDGCGTGLLLERLQSYSVGIDLSSSLLSMALTRLSEKGQTFLIQADAEQLPFRNHIFEKVFSVTLIQNTPKPELTFVEIKRVARVGSEAVITALKKSYTSQGFRHLITASGFTLKYYIEDGELKDWIAFTTIKKHH